MRLALIVIIATIGVLVTLFAAVRMRAVTKAGAPREHALGYMALMLLASALSFTLLRLV